MRILAVATDYLPITFYEHRSTYLPTHTRLTLLTLKSIIARGALAVAGGRADPPVHTGRIASGVLAVLTVKPRLTSATVGSYTHPIILTRHAARLCNIKRES